MEADLRELARLPDVLAVCSSAGWTDQRHVLYLSLLQESFVNQLHQGEIGGFRGLFSNLSPRTSGHEQSPKVDRAKSMKKVEQQVRSASSEHRKEDGQVHHSTEDDDASSTETAQESSSSSQASATSSGQPSSSSTSHCGKVFCEEDSVSRTAAEGSDQNFIDEDTEGSGESRRRRRRGNKRLKSPDDTMDDEVRERRCIHEEGRTAASGLPQWKKRRGHRWP